MSDHESRLRRIEEAIIAIAELRDPAQRDFPVVGSDPRSRARNAAEHSLARIADELRLNQRTGD